MPTPRELPRFLKDWRRLGADERGAFLAVTGGSPLKGASPETRIVSLMTGGGEIEPGRAIRGAAPWRDDAGRRSEDADTADLVARIQGGEDELFAKLYERYFSRVYGYLVIVLGDEGDVEDATQEVFTQVFEALPSYQRRRQPFRAWMFTIARHHALSRLRKSKRLVVSDPENVDRLRDRGAGETADLAALSWISDGDLLIFIERLPVSQRQVLALRYLLDLQLTEVAKILDRSPEDVRILHHRALRFLEHRLTAVARRPQRGEKARFHRRRRQSGILRLRRFALH